MAGCLICWELPDIPPPCRKPAAGRAVLSFHFSEWEPPRQAGGWRNNPLVDAAVLAPAASMEGRFQTAGSSCPTAPPCPPPPAAWRSRAASAAAVPHVAGTAVSPAAAAVRSALRLLVDPLPIPWKALLSPDVVRSAEAYYGTGQTLRHVAAKLLAGQPIKVTARCQVPVLGHIAAHVVGG